MRLSLRFGRHCHSFILDTKTYRSIIMIQPASLLYVVSNAGSQAVTCSHSVDTASAMPCMIRADRSCLQPLIVRTDQAQPALSCEDHLLPAGQRTQHGRPISGLLIAVILLFACSLA